MESNCLDVGCVNGEMVVSLSLNRYYGQWDNTTPLTYIHPLLSDYGLNILKIALYLSYTALAPCQGKELGNMTGNSENLKSRSLYIILSYVRNHWP